MSKSTKLGLFFLSFSMIFVAGLLFILARQRFNRYCAAIPDGSTVNGFPIEGLSADQIAESLLSIYNAPVQLQYEENLIQVSAGQFGLNPINVEMIRSALRDSAAAQCSSDAFLSMLFGKTKSKPIQVEIPCSVDENAIRDWLTAEIGPRYDTLPIAAQPNTLGIGFYKAVDGKKMDIDEAAEKIAAAFCSTDQRIVKISVETVEAEAPHIENLKLQIRSVIDQYQDAGQLTEVVLIDPKTGNTFDLARRHRNDLEPEISFTAASTIKVPVMISSFARMDSEPDPFTIRQLELMITESKNDQTDWMMETHVGGNLAPITVTDDMHTLGLENTFLSGYFYLGAPLLRDVETPANQRADIDLKPDRYNQTTAADMATLMEGLYHCEKDGSGLLTATFPDKITQQECRTMVELLKNNKLPLLISAGIPELVPIAHKHGWIEESDGLLRTMSNIAIIYSPGGDYILSVFTWHPSNLIFDKGNRLFAMISTAVYNYFNPNLDR